MTTVRPKLVPQSGPHRDDTEILDFMEAFGRALTAGDARAVAELWETPALVLGDTEVHAVKSRAEVERFFAGANEVYAERGIHEAKPQLVRWEWATERVAIVRVRWPYLDVRGAEIGGESSIYTLRRDETGALKLRMVTMLGEEPP